MEDEKFIFCLEAVPDIESDTTTDVVKILENIALKQGVASIYKACDSIEGLEESLSNLLYDDHNFKDYEIIYLVMPGESNNILLNDYYYSIEEIAELFEGKMNGKVIHFANKKVLDLTDEESQYFLDVTGARAISGYGSELQEISSANTIDRVFFSMYQENDDLKEVVESMFQKHYNLCKLLDFRLYY
ncbi:hypothetical protein ESY86_03685 [Subsaximicrobium wynnwilliamsii]|uniref:Uncharacterized protein n=1 Tax=Subsaximicrobium wynnwilliamsii TaxID=291179 RepID=A0A5C6ZLF5_9FLAO|nr:DUF6642 family protein [Subsaximicrobium wynnwilliamsii]TXD84979.1 hypothetical protein ESY87_03465 [Subsaximicrobium wynnwilliamsii]TXD90649.1 hypothetical protein ESY86_03685 [Subsaximicrobium wynnwilliamsii]TXE05123.1 hypothetical protein ESY88_01990 [Subsaximicrobium wynnwilliamsii]